MKNRINSLWTLFQERRLSRRTFMKSCVALTAILGLPPTMLDTVVKAAETTELPTVIWLHGHECTGCSESFIRSSSPFTSDVILNMISLEYDDTLAAASGAPLEEHLEKIIKEKAGKYILAVEGGVPLDEDGVYCTVGGRTFKESLSSVVSGKPIIKVPGCPPIPEVMTGVIMHYALFGQIPPLDSQGRPKQFYGNRIHDTCYRRAFFDSGLFVEKFDDDASKSGWCLYKVGCRGPQTYNSCGNLRWWNGLSYPIQSGHGCIGCSEKGFWDNDVFYKRLPDIPLANTITTADTIGTVAAVGATAAVIVHGAATLTRNKILDMKEEKRLKEQGLWDEKKHNNGGGH